MAQLRILLVWMMDEAQAMGGSEWFLGAMAQRLRGAPMHGQVGYQELKHAETVVNGMVVGLRCTARWHQLADQVEALWPAVEAEWRLGG